METPRYAAKLKRRRALLLTLAPVAIIAAWSTAVPLLARAQTGSDGKATAGTDAAAPDYAAYSQTYRIPFSRRVDFNRLTSLHVRASINGGPPTGFEVDTGSVGIIVSADEVPNIDPKAPEGSIKYSSSGIELDGVWTTATVTFPDAKGGDGKIATAVVPVLAVRERKVSGVGVNAEGATASLHPKVHMFGIGFGRGGAESHQERNAFVNLIEMQAGTMRRGYTITRDGYTLGLTASSAGPGYLYQKLKERAVSDVTKSMKPGLKDWETATGSVTVGAMRAPTGTILLDTGLTNMMIAVPDSPGEGEVTPGTDVTISLLGGREQYSFKVGDAASPVSPHRVTWIWPTLGVYVNTGLRALSQFDYLYDADGGYLGLRRVAK